MLESATLGLLVEEEEEEEEEDDEDDEVDEDDEDEEEEEEKEEVAAAAAETRTIELEVAQLKLALAEMANEQVQKQLDGLRLRIQSLSLLHEEHEAPDVTGRVSEDHRQEKDQNLHQIPVMTAQETEGAEDEGEEEEKGRQKKEEVGIQEANQGSYDDPRYGVEERESRKEEEDVEVQEENHEILAGEGGEGDPQNMREDVQGRQGPVQDAEIDGLDRREGTVPSRETSSHEGWVQGVAQCAAQDQEMQEARGEKTSDDSALEVEKALSARLTPSLEEEARTQNDASGENQIMNVVQESHNTDDDRVVVAATATRKRLKYLLPKDRGSAGASVSRVSSRSISCSHSIAPAKEAARVDHVHRLKGLTEWCYDQARAHRQREYDRITLHRARERTFHQKWGVRAAPSGVEADHSKQGRMSKVQGDAGNENQSLEAIFNARLRDRRLQILWQSQGELQSVQTEMSTIDSALAQNRSLHDVYRAHFQEAGKVTERMKALNRIRSGQEQVHLHRT